MNGDAMLKPQIKFEDFKKVDMRIGTVISVENIEGSEKLLKLMVDFGELGKRQILSGIKEWFKPKSLVGKQLAFVINIEPRKMMGLESQGMVLATESEGKVTLISTKKKVKNGLFVC
jgi:methionine--tRNA ligase beta chain